MSEWYTVSGDTQPNDNSNLSASSGGVSVEAGPGALGGDHNAFHNTERTTGGLGSVLDAGGGAIHSRQIMGSDTIADPNGSGMRTDVATAVGLGWIFQNADGSYTEGAGQPQVAPAQGTSGAPQDGAKVAGDNAPASAAFNAGDAAEAVFDAIAQAMPGTQAAIVDGIVNGGDIPDHVAQRAAVEMGIEPGDVVAQVEILEAGMLDSALNHVADRIGTLDVTAFEAFASTPEGAEMTRQAARELLTANDTATLEEMADQFAERMDVFAPDDVLDACNDAGIPVSSDGNGRLLLTLPNVGQVPFQVAVRQGLISLSGV
ncbi:hypothetical protein [Ruegeria arenilitoris]|uniref:hypothetical protein n=1 Tax=Ruegeria arenilitoris TaxID=1173585 RepID=UPI003C7E9359